MEPVDPEKWHDIVLSVGEDKDEHDKKSPCIIEMAVIVCRKNALANVELDRAQADLVVDNDDEEEQVEKEDKSKKKVASQPKKASLVPVFVKRRRRQPRGGEEPSKKIKTKDMVAGEKESSSMANKDEPASAGGLGGLLGGYGSSDSDSD